MVRDFTIVSMLDKCFQAKEWLMPGTLAISSTVARQSLLKPPIYFISDWRRFGPYPRIPSSTGSASALFRFRPCYRMIATFITDMLDKATLVHRLVSNSSPFKSNYALNPACGSHLSRYPSFFGRNGQSPQYWETISWARFSCSLATISIKMISGILSTSSCLNTVSWEQIYRFSVIITSSNSGDVL